MSQTRKKLLFIALFTSLALFTVGSQGQTFAQTLRSTVPLPNLRYLDFADDAIGFNPATNRIYLFGYVSGQPQFGYLLGQPNKALTVLDASDNSQLAVIPIDF